MTLDKRQKHLKIIRQYELQQALQYFPTSGHILEIGAGAGWQAQWLSNRGYEVTATDIPESRYLQNKVFPIILYDGINLPFPDSSFDIIFSSNVLEHISDLDAFEDEIKRVIKPRGIAVHILPTTTWRFWTFLGHYLWVCRRLFDEIQKRNSQKEIINSNFLYTDNRWRYLFWPNRHGALGNSLSELYRFSYRSWSKHFTLHGWQLYRRKESEFFYTGNQIFHSKISSNTRRKLAYFLGSSSRIYILKSTNKNNHA